jgi:hypothetical protein
MGARHISEEAMLYRYDVFSPKSLMFGCALLLFAACDGGSGAGGTAAGGQSGQSAAGGTTSGGSSGGASTTSSSNTGGQVSTSSKTGGATGSGGQAGTTSVGGATGSGGQAGTTSVGGATGSGGQTSGAGGQTVGAGGSQTGGTTSGGTGGTGAGGKPGGSGGQAGSTRTGGQTGSPGVDGGLTSACVGKAWPTADPTKAGPFKVKAEKGVGPLAGYIPDPIYGDKQQRFNIYRPDTLESSGYCHPILVWSNGHTDNPEQNPPDCVVNSGANKWCGQYLPVMQHLASHGFVVIASLSTTTSKGDPLPSIVGLDWLLQQSEDSTSAYYHRLDTAHIGAFGHSEGGMATCMMAKDPRFTAISTVSGTSTITGLHGPALFFCGGQENGVCDNTQKVVDGITTQPAMMINNLGSDHGHWAYEGAGGVDLSGFAAWFRLHLMGDTAQRKRFFGDGCTFCTDSRVKVYRNSLMTQ